MDAASMWFLVTTLLASTTWVVAIGVAARLLAVVPPSWPSYGLTVIAISFDSCALTALTTTALLHARRVQFGIALTFWIACLAVCLFGTVISLFSFGSAIHYWSLSNAPDQETELMASEAALTTTVIGIFLHIILFVWMWPSRNTDIVETIISPHEMLQPRESPQFLKHKLSSIRLGSLMRISPPLSETAPRIASPAFSRFSISPKNSFRNSLTHALRPTNSKTRLINGRSPSRDSHGTVTPSETPEPIIRTHEESTTRNTEQHHPNTKKRLEPIPGSRPVSPANPLNGPFPFPTPPPPATTAHQIIPTTATTHLPNPDTFPLPTDPPHPPIRSTSSTSLQTTASTRPPPTRSASASTVATTAQDQAHIHPLFRTESPVPPPARSPGTSIVASPFGGQVFDVTGSPDLSERVRGRGERAGSRAGTPVVGVEEWVGK